MSDTLRIVEFAYAGARPTEVLDLNDGEDYALVRDTFNLTPGEKNQSFSMLNKRYGGGTLAQETHGNATLEAEWYITGTDADDSIDLQEAFLAAVDDLTVGQFLEWKPEGATYAAYFEKVAGMSYDPMYRWIEFAGRKTLHIKAGFTVKPLAQGLPMNLTDDFSVNSIGDYTFDAGVAGNVAITGGQLTAVGNLTTENRLIETARGYEYGDVQVQIKVTPGSTIASFKAGAILKRIDDENYIECYIDDNGTNSRIRIDKVVATARTNLATTNLGARVSNGTTFWLVGRIENNTIYADYFTASSPPNYAFTAANASRTYTMSVSEATTFGYTVTGRVGFSWTPQQAAAVIDDFDISPYNYHNGAEGTGLALPDTFKLNGAIPGNAPALCEVVTDVKASSYNPVFAAMGWTQDSPSWNRVCNGDFEEDANNWTAGAVTTYGGAATSISRVTSSAKYGAASGEIVCPASINTSAYAVVPGMFRKGISYTAGFWIRSAAQVTNFDSFFGSLVYAKGQNHLGDTALSSTWTYYSYVWTPTQDVNDAMILFQNRAATAATFQIDGVQIYETSKGAPTLVSQTEGRGAYPPFGLLEDRGADTGDVTTWAVSGPGEGYTDGYVRYVFTSGAGTASAAWFIDPSLLPEDPFTKDETSIDVWGFFIMDPDVTSMKATISAYNSLGSGFGATRYTTEYGSAGKVIILGEEVLGGTNFRAYRLGTLNLSTNRKSPARWKLKLEMSWGAGSTGYLALDHLFILPSNTKALSPSGKAQDSYYPNFVGSTSRTIKRIASDLSGWIRTYNQSGKYSEYPDHGIGGPSLLELQPGTNQVFMTLRNKVPESTEVLDDSGTTTAAVRFNVTPRWNVLRGS
jgi:hypothetical protein